MPPKRTSVKKTPRSPSGQEQNPASAQHEVQGDQDQNLFSPPKIVISTCLPDEYRFLMKIIDGNGISFVDKLPKSDVERVCFNKTISKKTVSQGTTPTISKKVRPPSPSRHATKYDYPDAPEEKVSDDAMFESDAVKNAEESISNNAKISSAKIQDCETDYEEPKHASSTMPPYHSSFFDKGATPQTQDHDAGSALELEEHSQDGRSSPRVTDTYAERQGPLAYQKTTGESISSTRSDVKLEEFNTTSRPAENLRSESKLEEPSKLIFQRQVLDVEEPTSAAHMDKAKVKGAMPGGYVSTQDHQEQPRVIDFHEAGEFLYKYQQGSIGPPIVEKIGGSYRLKTGKDGNPVTLRGDAWRDLSGFGKACVYAMRKQQTGKRSGNSGGNKTAEKPKPSARQRIKITEELEEPAVKSEVPPSSLPGLKNMDQSDLSEIIKTLKAQAECMARAQALQSIGFLTDSLAADEDLGSTD